jgi:phytoene dehydrogenase-like protein
VSKKEKAEEHDIIILGSGLGGLIAGALLSRHYRKILLLKERRCQPSFVREGYRFVPFSNFSERRLKRSLLQKISRTLDLPPLTGDRQDGSKAYGSSGKTKQESTFQVILPEARVDLFGQRSVYRREWKREFSKETDRIANFYKEMEHIRPLLTRMKSEGDPWSAFPIRPSPWIKRWLPFNSLPRERVSEKLSPFSQAFREFIRLQLISWGNLCSDQFPLYLAAYLLLQDEGGERISEIDLEEMKKKILEIFARSGGKIEEIEGVEKIERKWLRGFELSLKGETRALRSRFVLWNSPLHHLPHLLARKERKLSKWAERIQPRYALLPLFLGIDEKVIPVGMRDLLISILDLEKPYGGGNLLLIHLGPKADGESAPEGKRSVTVESLVPVERSDPHSLDEHLKGVMRHLHHLFPFLDHYLEFTDWSWAKEQLLCWSYPHFLYETNHDFNWGVGVVPARLSRSLYFVGKERFPYLGLEGEVLGGKLVAKQLMEKFKS